MTFSLAARCPATGQLGVALTTSSIAIGARCPWVKAGVGAVATQNITDPRLGPRILEQLQGGLGAAAALDAVMADAPHSAYRQVTVIDAAGATAHFSGAETLGTHGAAVGENAVAAGNLLANAQVPEAIIAGFTADTGTYLADHLMAGLRAGLKAGGEEGPVHSAALLVAGTQTWPLVDLRVDWSEDDPVAELAGLWARYAPEMQSYVDRALDPATAPSFGVPGDE